VLINLTVLSLSFFFNSFFFAPGAIAQTQASYEEQIAAFASKLKVAQGTQDDLSQRAACLSQRDAALTAQRSDSEVALGNLLRREEVLKQNITQQSAAYDGFSKRSAWALWKPTYCMSTIADRARRRMVCT
jgi:hypothetical protein